MNNTTTISNLKKSSDIQATSRTRPSRPQSPTTILHLKSVPHQCTSPLPKLTHQPQGGVSRSAESVSGKEAEADAAHSGVTLEAELMGENTPDGAIPKESSVDRTINHQQIGMQLATGVPQGALYIVKPSEKGSESEEQGIRPLGHKAPLVAGAARLSLDDSTVHNNENNSTNTPISKNQSLRLKLSQLRMPRHAPSVGDTSASLPATPLSSSSPSRPAPWPPAQTTPKKGHRFRLHPLQNRSTPDLVHIASPPQTSLTAPSTPVRGNLTPTGLLSRRPSGLPLDSVKETSVIVRDYDPQTGNKMINQYMIVRELGRGCHGKVKLAVDTVTGEHWAIKVVEKHARRRFTGRLALSQRLAAAEEARAKGMAVQLPNPHLEKIKREIAILKKCDHPHVVRLKEVIDDPMVDKIYLVLEYLAGGDIRWHDFSEPRRPTLGVDEARRIFRDVLCGVQYLHYQGILHRDIKPANLLWTAERRVKISDFGVSVFVGKRRRQRTSGSSSTTDSELGEEANEIELAKTAGSPAFFAPELCGVTDDDPSMFLPFNPFGTNASTETPGSLPDGRSTSDVGGQISHRSSLLSEGSLVPGMPSARVSSTSLDNVASGSSSPSRKVSGKSERVRSIDVTGGLDQLPSLAESPGTGTPSSPSPISPLSPSSDPDTRVPTQKGKSPETPSSPRRKSLVLPKPLPPIGKAIDVWAMGVTLYCFVFGRVPFIAETEFELFNVISKQPLEFPSDPPIDRELKDLFLRILEKDPTLRITLEEIKLHPWTTADMTRDEREEWLMQTDPDVQYGEPLDVTEEEMRGAVTIASRIRERIRKISSSFQNLAAGFSLRRRTKSLPSVTAVNDVEARVKVGTPKKWRMQGIRTPGGRRPERANLENAKNAGVAGTKGTEEGDYFTQPLEGSGVGESEVKPPAGMLASRSLSPPRFRVMSGESTPSTDQFTSEATSSSSSSHPPQIPLLSTPTRKPAGEALQQEWIRWDRSPGSLNTAWIDRGDGSASPTAAYRRDFSPSPRGLPSRLKELTVVSSSDEEGEGGAAAAEMQRMKEWKEAYLDGEEDTEDPDEEVLGVLEGAGVAEASKNL